MSMEFAKHFQSMRTTPSAGENGFCNGEIVEEVQNPDTNRIFSNISIVSGPMIQISQLRLNLLPAEFGF